MPVGGHPAGVPAPLTSFIGREQELADAARLVSAFRLVTLTGPGGGGKSRLAIELARRISDQFGGGVFFVPLAGITDAGLVGAAIAQAVGIRAPRSRSLSEALAERLRSGRVLLILDNFEHVLAAGPFVADLLRATLHVRVLVTSRAPLRVAGEHRLPVPPLQVAGTSDGPASAAACEAVRLFAERATAVVAAFALDDATLPAVVEIASRLDGLPLAIELAASRVRVLPPASMLPRLEQALPLLVGGPRDAPDRQRTLLRTFEWSEALLGPGARRLLAICSVFRGGFGLATLEAVAGAFGIQDVLAPVDELVDQGFLVPPASPPGTRFTMLETVRQYAADLLVARGDVAPARDAHARAFLAFCQDAAAGLTGPEVAAWVDRLGADHDNIRAALDWLQEHEPASALDMAVAVSRFWGLRGHYEEGRRRLSVALERASEPTPQRVAALNAAADLAIDQGDISDATRLLGESLDLSRRLNDPSGEATALLWSARLKVFDRRARQALPDVELAAAVVARTDDPIAEVRLLHISGMVEYYTGRREAARAHFERSARRCADIGFDSLRISSLTLLGVVQGELGHHDEAREALVAALSSSIAIGQQWMIPLQLTGLAGLAARNGQPRQAMKLAGAAAAYGESKRSLLPTSWIALVDEWLRPARIALGPLARKLLAEGRRMTLDEAEACARSFERETDPRRATLTRREIEVAGLVAEGLPNREIARRLDLSVRTVEVHVDHILTKLDLDNRTKLAAWMLGAAGAS